jgi:hypothetical protein
LSQLNKRLADDQLRAFFHSCCQGTLSQTEIQKVLEIGKTRLVVVLKVFRGDPQNFTIACNQRAPAKLS